MSQTITLRGLTWDHPRACDGLFAETARYNGLGTGIRLEWDVHSLRGFEATPIAQTAAKYDLLILDHPFMGDVSADNTLMNLRDYIDALDLETLAESYAGASFRSYEYKGGLWALPIDAASQAAVCRPDLIRGKLPKTFADVLAFAESGDLGLSMANPHAFMNFLGIAGRLGADISGAGDRLLPKNVAEAALLFLRQMASHIPDAAFDWSSIDLLEAMATTQQVSYCPMVFSFNTYCQTPQDGRHELQYSDLPEFEGRKSSAGAVLGGTGLAISAATNHPQPALSVVSHFTGKSAQLRMAGMGGQPAHKSVWSADAPNTINGPFFDQCRSMQQGAITRPRHPGYIHLQNSAGDLLRDDAMNQTRKVSRVIDDLEDLFRKSRQL